MKLTIRSLFLASALTLCATFVGVFGLQTQEIVLRARPGFANQISSFEVVHQVVFIRDLAVAVGGRSGWAVGFGGTILRLKAGQWRVDEEASALTDAPLWSVWATGEGNEGWAVGFGGTILRLEAGQWRIDKEASALTGATLWSVWASGEGNEGWAVGGDGILRLEKGQWRVDALPDALTLTLPTSPPMRAMTFTRGLCSVWASGEGNEGWAVGFEGTILRLEKGQWRVDEAASSLTDAQLVSVWASGEGNEGWAVGDKGTILRLEKGQWRVHTVPGPLTAANLYSLWAIDEGNAGWAVGQGGTILRLENSGWRIDEGASALTTAWLLSVWASGEGNDGWVVGEAGTILRLEKGQWRVTALPGALTAANLYSVWASGEGKEGWAVGARGTILRLEKGQWGVEEEASALTDVPLASVWANAEGKEGWAVGARGTILRLEKGQWGVEEEASALTRGDSLSFGMLIGWLAELLGSVWAHGEGNGGWAVGIGGSDIILRLGEGQWRVDKQSRGIIDDHVALSSVWASGKGNNGWAVGSYGTILRLEEGQWWVDEEASTLSGVNLWSVWASGEGNAGWVVGERGTILRFESRDVGVIELTSNSGAHLNQLKGPFSLSFDVDVVAIEEVQVVERRGDDVVEQLTNSEYHIERLGPREFKLELMGSALAKRLQGQDCQLIVTAQLTANDYDDVVFETDLEIGSRVRWWQTPRGRSLLLGLAVVTLLTGWIHLRPGRPEISKWVPFIAWMGAFSPGALKVFNGPTLAGVLGAWFGALVVGGAVSPKVFRLIVQSQPFEWVGSWLLLLPRARRRLYDDYVNEMKNQLAVRHHKDRSEAYERYMALPAACLGPERSAERRPKWWSENSPALFLRALLTDRDPGRRAHVYIEAVGGRGKSALLHEVVQQALDAFGDDPNSPLPVLASGSGKTLQEIAERSLGLYAFSPKLLRQELEAGGFFLVFDDLRDGELTARELGERLKAEGRSVPLLLSSRPAPAFRDAVQEQAHRWCQVEPLALDDATLERFVSHYTDASRTALAPALRQICRAPDGSYLPVLVRLALLVDDAETDSVADLYQKVFDRLLRGRDEELYDWLAAHCVATHWRTGARELPCRHEPEETRDRLARLLDAGVLVSAEGKRRDPGTLPRFLRFFHDSMQSYFTAVGLFQSKEEPREVLWRAAGAQDFVAVDPDAKVQEESELFRMCVHVYPPKELAGSLMQDLLAWAENFDDDLRKRDVYAALTSELAAEVRTAVPSEQGAGAVLKAAAQRCRQEGLEPLSTLYARLAPRLWRLREERSSG